MAALDARVHRCCEELGRATHLYSEAIARDTTDPTSDAPATAAEIVGLLAETDRLRVAAALVLGAASLTEVVDASGLGHRAAAVALERLTRGGLAVPDGTGGVRLATERLRQVAREGARAAAGPGSEEADASSPDPVLRSFVRGEQLVSIPAARAKRLVVLEWLAARFEPGRTYPEAETNLLLRQAHPDHAALRRYLVDEGLLERRDGFYWRAGGTFDID